jgi:hypothetical protein
VDHAPGFPAPSIARTRHHSRVDGSELVAIDDSAGAPGAAVTMSVVAANVPVNRGVRPTFVFDDTGDVLIVKLTRSAPEGTITDAG